MLLQLKIRRMSAFRLWEVNLHHIVFSSAFTSFATGLIFQVHLRHISWFSAWSGCKPAAFRSIRKVSSHCCFGRPPGRFPRVEVRPIMRPLHSHVSILRQPSLEQFSAIRATPNLCKTISFRTWCWCVTPALQRGIFVAIVLDLVLSSFVVI